MSVTKKKRLPSQEGSGLKLMQLSIFADEFQSSLARGKWIEASPIPHIG